VSSEAALLQLEGVSLAFSGVKALEDVSFEVRKGEILAIIGPNGAGKSSLLNVISGLYRADRGIIRFNGLVQSQGEPRQAALRGIARTFQNLSLFRGMTVLENLLIGRILTTQASLLANAFSFASARREEAAQRARIEPILQLLGISTLRHALVGKLPYGLQKRVELGRALAAEPKLLLLDEPMAGMNLHEKQEMTAFIRDANTSLGTTIVLIEHDMGVVMGLSDRVVVLEYGRKIADATPELVSADPAVISAYLGVAHSDAA
jgi:branched-chain amino acid transport system ATP-binding protein